MAELTPLFAALFFFGGLLAGTVDAIAGGGGLISLPLLLGAGLPVPIALGTNKLQSSVGTLVATHHYFKNRLLSFEHVLVGLISGMIGSALGAATVAWMNPSFLQHMIPFVLTFIFFYTLLTPKLGSIDSKKRLSERWFYLIFGFSLGFYDGFLGPGTGSFWIISFVFFMGYNLAKATAYTKLFNLNSNLIALLCFAYGHNVDYRTGLIMASGQLVGGKLGSHLVVTKGAKLVRPIFLMVVSATILFLFYKMK